MSLAWDITIILLLILINGFLALAEIAVVSARKARLQGLAEHGNRGAQTALELAGHPTEFLSAVQVGITLIGILAGVFSGATIAQPIAQQLKKIAFLVSISDMVAYSLVVVVITFLSLVIGELVPKRLALQDAERLATVVAGPMKLVWKITRPLVSILSACTDFIVRILGIRTSNLPPVTEDEIKILIQQGTTAGVFEEAEQEMFAGVIRLGDRRVGSIMTPRMEISWLDLEDSPETNLNLIVNSKHSRLLVAKGDLDHLRGLIVVKDILASVIQGAHLDLISNLEPPHFIPENLSALNALEIFKESGRHLLPVIDEYGGIQGLVTLNDILEAIIGDIPALGEEEEPKVIRREDGSFLLDGLLPLDELVELLPLHNLPDSEKSYYQTLGGLVMHILGEVPQSGDHFELGEFRFEVVDMDGLRVDKVIILPIQQQIPSINSDTRKDEGE